MKNEAGKTKKVDGRAQRSERSRQQIIDAMIALIYEGNLIPTAQQVADKANIAIRTVFRHFSEMEQLLSEIDNTMKQSYIELFGGGDRTGSVEERIEKAMAFHSYGYSELEPVILCARSMIWRSEMIKKNYVLNQTRLRKDLEQWIPEVTKLSTEEREAVDAIASFEFWHRLVRTQGLDAKLAVTLTTNMVKSIMLDTQ